MLEEGLRVDEKRFDMRESIYNESEFCREKKRERERVIIMRSFNVNEISCD